MSCLFRRGFGAYLENKEYADLVVVINNNEYNVHRIGSSSFLLNVHLICCAIDKAI